MAEINFGSFVGKSVTSCCCDVLTYDLTGLNPCDGAVVGRFLLVPNRARPGLEAGLPVLDGKSFFLLSPGLSSSELPPPLTP